MGKYVYPRAKVVNNIEELGENVVAERIIAARENGLSKAQSLGVVLQGSDDIKTFNIVWRKINKEIKAFRAVNPKDYNSKSEFKSALPSEFLDKSLWYQGLEDEAEVTNWNELKAYYEGLE